MGAVNKWLALSVNEKGEGGGGGYNEAVVAIHSVGVHWP